ncbi:chaplin [Kitasatospora kifunensis]|uniref:Chaplin domain-containing protein n=1 Tax=Kitasatospora kifunensis TaxID=58351 RepID=A0A7W7VUE2_KITKI|nr:hypothetical protein [Kitasatospora kifunensis]
MATGSVLASTAGYAYASADASGAAVGSPGVGSGNTVQVPVDAPVNVCGNTVDVVGLLNPAYGNQCGNSSPHGGAVHGGQNGGGQNGGQGRGQQGGGQQGGGSQAGGSGDQNGPGGSQQGSWPGSPAMPGVPGTPAMPGGASPSGPVIHTPAGGHGSGSTSAGSSASGVSSHSPGVASGNTGQLPVDVPVNLCGDSINVVGALNPVMGNDCANHESTPVTPAPSTPIAPPAQTWPVQTPPAQTLPTGSTRAPAAPPVAVPVAAAVPVSAPAAAARPAAPAVKQLAFTGSQGLDVIAPAGLALLIAGGVLYRRSRTAA